MNTPFYLPDLGEGLAEAQIRQWYVHAGQVVALDQPMVAVETAKALVDIPSPYAGKIMACHGQVDQVVATGALLVEFELNRPTACATVPAKDQPRQHAPATVVGTLPVSQRTLPASPPFSSLSEASLSSPTATATAVRAVPLARRVAKQQGVALHAVPGRGPGGVITVSDVMDYVDQMQAEAVMDDAAHSGIGAGAAYSHALSGQQRAMVQRMEAIQRAVVPVTLTETVLLPPARPVTDLTVSVMQALVHAMQVVPAINAHFDRTHLVHYAFTDVHLGVAMDVDNALYLPVLAAAQQHPAAALRQRIDVLKEKARTHAFSPADLRPLPTFVLSNFGTIAGRYATPLVVPPAVAIMGVGRLDAARTLPISLTIDHRALTGMQAAQFLRAFKENMRMPLENATQT